MKRLKAHGGLLAVLAITVVLFSLLPLGTAFQFGDDEGFTLIKGFLHFKGYKLYKEIWSDQPPVSTLLLSAAFKGFGPTILTGRLVAAGFGLVLIGSFYELVRRCSGQWTGLIATFFLLASPSVLLLSVSVMLEVPAIGLGLFSALLAHRASSPQPSPPKEERGKTPGSLATYGWLMASGAVMGVALQTKFSAALLIPAIVVKMVLNGHLSPALSPILLRQTHHGGQEGGEGEFRKHPRSQLLRAVAIWAGSVVCVAAVIGIGWGRGSLNPTWRSHTGAWFWKSGHPSPALSSNGGESESPAEFGRPEDYRFEWGLVRNHVECVAGAGVGIWMAWNHCRRRRKKTRASAECGVRNAESKQSLLTSSPTIELAFPVVILMTVTAVHAFHRPWFNYYYLHFAVPLAWLSGWAVAEVIRMLLGARKERGLWKALACCALVAVTVARSERRLESMMKDLRGRERADANPIVQALRENHDRVKLVYSELPIYAFHAGLVVPTDLAVITPKRFWSGQITLAEIVEGCKVAKPEGLILALTKDGKAWNDLLASRYARVADDGKSVLHLKRRLQPN